MAKFILQNPRILNGWKEIAAFMGRGVRTVQRWEALGLPVRRPNGHLRSAVTASAEELELWLAKAPVRELDLISELQSRIAELEAENSALRLELSLRQQRPAPTNIANHKPLRRVASR